jgi:transcriptional antiterminator NusG
MEYKWYILHATASHEKKIKTQIMEQALKAGLSDHFSEIIIPSVEYDSIKRGKKVVMEKKLMPGYMVVKMFMTEDSWHLVKSIPKVTNFLGSGRMPTPVSQAEVDALLGTMEHEAINVGAEIMYEVGDNIKIIDGPFSTFTGVIKEVDEEKSMLKVSVSILGRPTPITIGFTQVERI